MNTPHHSNPAYRILVVDDNHAIHDDMRKILVRDGGGSSDLLDDEAFLFQQVQVKSSTFELESAFQGQEGLDRVRAALAEGRPYALAFVDIRMPPGWDGVETVVNLWKADPDLQVVICTAYSDYSWNDIVTNLGHSDSLVILKKPFDNIEVIQLAHALTRKWTVSREAQTKRKDLERMVREATAVLSHQANHDALTDLPNRRLFADRMEQAIAFARRQVSEVALLYIDLDGFKSINDTLGHALGDSLLAEVVKRMKSYLRRCDTLARMGGDEFTLIATGNKEEEDAPHKIAERVRELLQKPFHVDGNELYITASIGISIYPQDGRDGAELLRNADAAMYEAKRQGKNRAVFYCPEIGQAANLRMNLENHLRSALEDGEFSLHYQPQFELETQRLVRFEALLRWKHPILGFVPPSTFIPIAEECGLIVAIGTWVLESACRTAVKWHEAGCLNVPVAVNVSSCQFTEPDFIDSVLGVLKKTKLPADSLELELTETAIVGDLAAMAPKIEQLRELGIRVAIDDFGSGYSSFSYLDQLPVSSVKIDRSFIKCLDSAPRARSVVKGMVTLAHSIGLRVVVEGVETAAQLEALFGSGADDVQGFHLGRPAPVEKHLPELAEAGSSDLDLAVLGPLVTRRM